MSRLSYRQALSGALLARRLELGLEQRHASERSGLSVSCLWKIEHGHATLGADNFIKLATAYEIPAWKIMRRVEKMLEANGGS